MSVLQQEKHVDTAVDLRSELNALVAGCGVYRLEHSLFSVTGRDRVRWLNGMITNNVRDLADGNGVYAFVLTPQGQIRGDLYVFSLGEKLMLEIERSQSEALLPLLRRYIIMDKVEIEDLSGQMSVVGVTGPKSSELLGQHGLDVSSLETLHISQLSWQGQPVMVMRKDNLVETGYELWGSSETAERIHAALLAAGAAEISDSALETFRVLSGVPKIGTDIREKSLPQETGQERALNFNKGCYIGQEIVERIRARGSVHKVITGFEVDGPAPSTGAKILSEGKEAGEITSVASVPTASGEKILALGYLRKEFVEASLTGGESRLRIASLPFTAVLQKLY
jgi:folate-binding protein YgfZ